MYLLCINSLGSKYFWDSLVESAISTVNVVSSAIPIETVSVPRSRLGKTKHGGVRLSNLKDLLHLCHY